MIKIIVQKIKTKKMEKSEKFLEDQTGKKKSTTRAFARTRAKKENSNLVFQIFGCIAEFKIVETF